MRFTDEYLDELAARNDIADVVGSYVRLTKKSGSNLFGLCPFHSEKTPSFSVSPDKQIYHCFGCGKGGGVISFIREIEGLEFNEAVEFLARRAGMPLPQQDEQEEKRASRRQRLLELNKAAARHWYENLISTPGNPGQQYIARRGIEMKWVKNFGLGYAPDSWSDLCDAMAKKGFTQQELITAGLMKSSKNGGGYDAFRDRLIFPVIDIRGNVIAFSGRIIGDGEPKYLNSPETPVFSKRSNLFAINLAKKSKAGYLILTEGNIDVVSLHQAGFDSAVASLGTSFTDEQARLMKRYADEVVLCYDADSAGRKASDRAIGILQKLDMRVRVLEMQGAKDPDEFIRAHGADAFRNLLEGSAGQVEYRLRVIEGKYDIATEEGRVGYLRESAALLASLPGDVEREVYAGRAAEKAGIGRDALLAEAKRIRKNLIRNGKRQEQQRLRPAELHQPSVREQRYTDVSAAVAEEGLVTLLYADPALCARTDLPGEEDFTSPALYKLYSVLLRREREGASVTPAALSAELEQDEMNLLSSIVNRKQLELSRSEQLLEDYITAMRKRRESRSEVDDLRSYAEKLRNEKNNYNS
ncbi:MAG: DNA primase [Oscillospiraceae bacterium]|nr:DNA primase [Oscillospiraceae bacterium]